MSRLLGIDTDWEEGESPGMVQGVDMAVTVVGGVRHSAVVSSATTGVTMGGVATEVAATGRTEEVTDVSTAVDLAGETLMGELLMGEETISLGESEAVETGVEGTTGGGTGTGIWEDLETPITLPATTSTPLLETGILGITSAPTILWTFSAGTT